MISRTPGPSLSCSFPAEIMTEGPNGEADYSNNRYWVRELQYGGGADWHSEWNSRYVTATNLSEAQNSHSLDPGTVVVVHSARTASGRGFFFTTWPDRWLPTTAYSVQNNTTRKFYLEADADEEIVAESRIYCHLGLDGGIERRKIKAVRLRWYDGYVKGEVPRTLRVLIAWVTEDFDDTISWNNQPAVTGETTFGTVADTNVINDSANYYVYLPDDSEVLRQYSTSDTTTIYGYRFRLEVTKSPTQSYTYLQYQARVRFNAYNNVPPVGGDYDSQVSWWFPAWHADWSP